METTVYINHANMHKKNHVYFRQIKGCMKYTIRLADASVDALEIIQTSQKRNVNIEYVKNTCLNLLSILIFLADIQTKPINKPFGRIISRIFSLKIVYF